MDTTELSLEEYALVFCNKIFKLFEYKESDYILGELQHNIYTYYNNSYSHHFSIKLYGPSTRDSKNLTIAWLSQYFNLKSGSEIEGIDEIINFAHKNISVENLDKYIHIISLIRLAGLRSINNLAKIILDLHLKFVNISLDDLINKWCIFYYRHKKAYFDLWFPNFVDKIKTLNNEKISELWWIWADYSGEYNSYLEWLPRETLDDLLMVANRGKYQPDYTTYIQ